MLDLNVANIIGTINGVVHPSGIAQDMEELSRVVGHLRALSDARRVASHVAVAVEDAARLPPRARSRRPADCCGREVHER